jgi:hypothetical protein
MADKRNFVEYYGDHLKLHISNDHTGFADTSPRCAESRKHFDKQACCCIHMIPT